MKKKLYATLFSFLVTACAPRYPVPPTLPTSVTQISTPQETQKWLENKNNITYRFDPQMFGEEDFWAPCALTYALKAGDCEDYAICAAALLQDNVQEGFIIYLDHPTNKSAHAVFAYKFNGYWVINSNIDTEFRSPQYSSLVEALQNSVGANYSVYTIFGYEGVDLINGNESIEKKMDKLGKYT